MLNSKNFLWNRLSKHRQAGASAIEFALVFPFVLLIFYGIICYSLILLHKQALTSISSEAARSTLAVVDKDEINTQIGKVIAGHSWITITDCSGGATYGSLQGNDLTLCMRTSLPPLPTINLGLFGLPSLPPGEETLANILKTEVTVLWQP